ncbi:MAG: histidine phosphatase family protein, partial [Clostridia bacterium]|nr:histidine phosphatase family protein [Clostridia bacterium]
VIDCFDDWFSSFGYKREGCYYRVTKECNDTILLASHGGSSCVVLSHILGIPFPLVCATFHIGLTSITTIKFDVKVGELICPKIEILGDQRHIDNITDI